MSIVLAILKRFLPVAGVLSLRVRVSRKATLIRKMASAWSIVPAVRRVSPSLSRKEAFQMPPANNLVKGKRVNNLRLKVGPYLCKDTGGLFKLAENCITGTIVKLTAKNGFHFIIQRISDLWSCKIISISLPRNKCNF